MGFLAPAALAALLIAGLPVMIHLLTSRAAQRKSFPALAFLRRAHAGQARLQRLRDLLVLLLRVLALILLVLTLAGLYWTGNHGAAGRPVVLILDASASMQQRDAGALVWDRAVATAARLSEELHDRPVLLLIAGQTIERSGLVPTIDRGPMRSLLANSSPGWGVSTNDQALALAIGALDNHGDIHLISDASRGTMAGIDPQAMPEGIGFQVINAGGGHDNQVIKSIALEPGVAVAGRSCVIQTDIGNYAVLPATLTVVISMGVDRRSQEVTIPAGESVILAQSFTPQRTGLQTVEVAIIARGANVQDSLPADDRRVGVVMVREALPVRVYTDESDKRIEGSLKPVIAGLTAAGLIPTVVRSDQLRFLPQLAARAHDAVVLTVGLQMLGDARALAGHLLGGGALVQFIVSDADAALTLALDGLESPLSVLPPVDLSQRPRGIGIHEVLTAHPLLIDLAGREPLLQQIDAQRYRPATLAPGATKLMAWEDGSIAMAERRVGSGRWIIINMSPADTDTNMAALEILPLIMARMGQVLQPRRRDECSVPCGFSMPSAVPMVKDGGGIIEVVEGACLLNQPGWYRGGNDVVAVAIPSSEGDVRQVPMPTNTDGATAEAAISLASTVPLWPWLLLIALLLFACESVIAGGVRRRNA